MDDRDKKTEMLVGLFVMIGLLLLGLLILQFGSIREVFKGTYLLTLPLPDASGIRQGSPVMLGGSRIGKVSKTPVLNPNFNGVTVLLDIYNDKKVPRDATFSLGTSGLLGDSFIQIKTTGSATQNYFDPGVTIPETNIAKSGGLGALQDTAKEVGGKVDVALEDIRGAVKDLRETVKKLNEGVLSDSAVKDLKESFKHLNGVLTRLDEKTLGDETTADVKSAVASLKGAAKTFEDSVRKLDPAFTKIDGVAAKADKVMDSADAALKSVDKTAASIGGAADDLRKGGGLLPALMKDAELKNEFKTLITNLREHGVLFYRDSAGAGREPGRKDAPPQSPRPLTGTKR